MGPRAGGLRDVAHDRHRTVERSPRQHSELHRRQILRLVDDDVAIRAHLVVLRRSTLAPRTSAEQRAGLIEQRHVVGGERDVVHRCRPRAVERFDLLVAQPRACRGP